MMYGPMSHVVYMEFRVQFCGISFLLSFRLFMGFGDQFFFWLEASIPSSSEPSCQTRLSLILLAAQFSCLLV